MRDNTGQGHSDTAPAILVGELLLDSIQAARLLGVHPKTLQRHARANLIPAIKVGKLWRYRKSSLDDWYDRELALVTIRTANRKG